ncbi:MAG: GNAT family N-acetyltransferase [Chryseobacterium sp.]|uniref:GNAT family N-acetyltransferase n=1 Tax=Chryseobacterium sp. TaxID=1871047 RepID=UPI0025C65678|nr:GNAT family N-acetyltransferase [Chryseobacterium sp.]MCJ7935672.1 GNAT family N-acetyltransferase [Chryseobacterium sp.]
MIYRKLVSGESKKYRTIRLESLEKFPESFGASYEEALKTEKFRTESDIEEQTPERFVFGAFADDELAGICTFVKNENNTGNIYQMYVKKEFQGKGIGLGLIEATIHEAYHRFIDIEIILEVTPGNNKAYNLYRKIGFVEITSTDKIGHHTVMRHIKN